MVLLHRTYVTFLDFQPARKRVRTGSAEHHQNAINSHPLQPPCNCKKNCIQHINQRRRVDIWTAYWQLPTYNNRRAFMCEQLERKKTKHADHDHHSNRTNFVSYFLKNSAGVRISVCKEFFLSTFGYTKQSSVIDSLLKSTPHHALTATPDARGGLREGHRMDKEAIKLHVESYNPALPNDRRRAHAPNRRYLPGELTITEMHSDYNAKNTDAMISYSTYQRVVSEMKISFAKRSKCKASSKNTSNPPHFRKRAGNK